MEPLLLWAPGVSVRLCPLGSGRQGALSHARSPYSTSCAHQSKPCPQIIRVADGQVRRGQLRVCPHHSPSSWQIPWRCPRVVCLLSFFFLLQTKGYGEHNDFGCMQHFIKNPHPLLIPITPTSKIKQTSIFLLLACCSVFSMSLSPHPFRIRSSSKKPPQVILVN